MNKTIIKRGKYISQVQKFVQTDLVKVIVGQRRVGKTYILLQMKDILVQEYGVSPDEIIYINKENIQWDSLRTYQDLYNTVKNYSYIFVDEIQDIEHWEKAIRSLQSEGGHDIYITGSNSNMLSSELSSFLAGRFVSFLVFPLTYREFLTFHKLPRGQEAFEKYLKFGGLPYLRNLKLDEEVIYPYLKDVVNTIILRDVISRNKLRNVDFYKQLIKYLSMETGSIFSAKNISDYLKSQKTNISPNVVLNYLDYSLSASFLHKVSRYDIQGKRVFEILQKYYFTDIGIKNSLAGGYSKLHISGILENVVYTNLRANGWEVKIGEIGGKEVDFIAEKNGEKMYIQVSYLLESEKTKKREFASLLAIPNSWSKYVLSLDEGASGTNEGVKWLHIEDFLYDIL